MYNFKNYLYPNSGKILNEITMEGIVRKLKLKPGKNNIGFVSPNGTLSYKDHKRLKNIQDRLNMRGGERILENISDRIKTRYVDKINKYLDRADEAAKNNDDRLVGINYHKAAYYQNKAISATHGGAMSAAVGEPTHMEIQRKKLKGKRYLGDVPENTNGVLRNPVKYSL